jgi:hypothetical protein
MALPLLALFAGLVGTKTALESRGRRRQREADATQLAKNQQTFSAMLRTAVDDNRLSEAGASLASNAFQIDPDEGLANFNRFVDRRIKRDTQTQTAFNQERSATQAADDLAFRRKQEAFDKSEIARGRGPLALQDALSKDTKFELVFDEETKTETVQPRSGTKPWDDRVIGTQKAAQAQEVFNQYMFSLSSFGVLRDKSNPETGRQDGLRTDLLFALKEMTAAGALDQGLIDVAERLTGSADAAAEFFLGSDQSAMQRAGVLGQRISNELNNRNSQTRLLRGILPEQRQAVIAVQEQTQAINQFSEQRLQQLAQGGFDQVRDIPQLGGSQVDRETLIENQGREIRELGGVLGGQIDNITSLILGAFVGKGFR